MELLQSQAPVEGEWSGNSAVRKLDIQHWSLDFGHWILELRHLTLELVNWTCFPQKMKLDFFLNKMELLQSQAPVEGELLGNSADRKLDIGV